MAKTMEEFEAWLDEMDGIRPAKPKAVVENGLVVRETEARVSNSDPNYEGSDGGVVRVRRDDWLEEARRQNRALIHGRGRGWKVEVDKTTSVVEGKVDPLFEQQRDWRREQRRLRKALDPFRIGHWGDGDDAA